jgi:hypothetical protein
MARRLASYDVGEVPEPQARRGLDQLRPRPNIVARQLVLIEMNQYLDAGQREVLRRLQHGGSDWIPASAG